MALPTIVIETNEYRRSHMKEPRGRGSWAFRIHGMAELFFTPGSTTYGEAVKLVRIVARDFAIKTNASHAVVFTQP